MALNETDMKVLKAIYQKTLEKNSDIIPAKDLGINEIDLTDSLEMLSRYNYIDLSLSTIGSNTIRITPKGFYKYTTQFDKAKHALFELVVDQIINKKEYNSNVITKSLNISALITHLIIHYFSDIGELIITEFMDGRIEIDHVGVELKRKYQKRNGA
jgi:hypothetical protein